MLDWLRAEMTMHVEALLHVNILPMERVVATSIRLALEQERTIQVPGSVTSKMDMGVSID